MSLMATILPMTWRVLLPAAVVGLLGAFAPVAAQDSGIPATLLRQALIEALTPALPYPRAGSDGIPESGDAGPAWSVRWPEEGDEPRVEVMANPLNVDTQKRAAQAEKEAQAAVMRAQRKSQSDYERALGEFERERRVSPIREVTLEDEGLAGERFDAESQLLVTLETLAATAPLIIPSSLAPTSASVNGRLVVRVAPNTYREQKSSADTPSMRYAPASARLYFGDVEPPTIRRVDELDRYEVTVPASPRSAVVVLSGNQSLIADVIDRADWKKILAVLER